MQYQAEFRLFPLDGISPRLRELGYVEGWSIFIDYRRAEGTPDQFPALAGELFIRLPSCGWIRFRLISWQSNGKVNKFLCPFLRLQVL